MKIFFLLTFSGSWRHRKFKYFDETLKYISIAVSALGRVVENEAT